MFGHKPAANGSPCPQMRGLLSQLSDGVLVGIALWYARRHTAHCPRCSAALEGLITLDARLHVYGLHEGREASAEPEIPAELRGRIESGLDRIDAAGSRP